MSGAKDDLIAVTSQVIVNVDVNKLRGTLHSIQHSISQVDTRVAYLETAFKKIQKDIRPPPDITPLVTFMNEQKTLNNNLETNFAHLDDKVDALCHRQGVTEECVKLINTDTENAMKKVYDDFSAQFQEVKVLWKEFGKLSLQISRLEDKSELEAIAASVADLKDHMNTESAVTSKKFSRIESMQIEIKDAAVTAATNAVTNILNNNSNSVLPFGLGAGENGGKNGGGSTGATMRAQPSFSNSATSAAALNKNIQSIIQPLIAECVQKTELESMTKDMELIRDQVDTLWDNMERGHHHHSSNGNGVSSTSGPFDGEKTRQQLITFRRELEEGQSMARALYATQRKFAEELDSLIGRTQKDIESAENGGYCPTCKRHSAAGVAVWDFPSGTRCLSCLQPTQHHHQNATGAADFAGNAIGASGGNTPVIVNNAVERSSGGGNNNNNSNILFGVGNGEATVGSEAITGTTRGAGGMNVLAGRRDRMKKMREDIVAMRLNGRQSANNNKNSSNNNEATEPNNKEEENDLNSTEHEEVGVLIRSAPPPEVVDTLHTQKPRPKSALGIGRAKTARGTSPNNSINTSGRLSLLSHQSRPQSATGRYGGGGGGGIDALSFSDPIRISNPTATTPAAARNGAIPPPAPVTDVTIVGKYNPSSSISNAISNNATATTTTTTGTISAKNRSNPTTFEILNRDDAKQGPIGAW